MHRASIRDALVKRLTRTPWAYELARYIVRSARRTAAATRLLVIAHFCVDDRGAHNVIEFAPDVDLRGVKMLAHGDSNRITAESGATLTYTTITLQGNNNTVEIGPDCHLAHTSIVCENDGNRITIGNRTRIMGRTALAALEGTEITIGDDCLLSDDIHFRTGDSHSVVNLRGERVNPSKSITLGDHVWIGTGAMILKGAFVAAHSIVGAQAVITRRFEEPNCVVAGNPARVVRRGVDWRDERISPRAK